MGRGRKRKDGKEGEGPEVTWVQGRDRVSGWNGISSRLRLDRGERREGIGNSRRLSRTCPSAPSHRASGIHTGAGYP